MKSRVVALALIVVCSLGAPAQTRRRAAWPKPSAFSGTGNAVSLSKAKLSAAELRVLRRVTAAQIDDLCGSNDEVARELVFQNLLVGRIQIASSGPRAFLVQGDPRRSSDDARGSSCLCGATGNCLQWIVSVSGGEGTVLYEKFSWGEVILRSQSRGYFDLVVASSAGGQETGLTMLRFNGIQYQPLRCASARDDGGGRSDSADKWSEVSEFSCSEGRSPSSK